jgi:hypothetical protein
MAMISLARVQLLFQEGTSIRFAPVAITLTRLR